MKTRFRDRTHAGRELATQLTAYANRSDVLVLGLPRGGVPVAYEVAKALNLTLDICLVRKLGVPGHKELAMGAIASGGVRVLNYDIISWLAISDKTLEHVAARELRELQRRDRSYRGDRPQPEICDRTILLIDDGLATGATMQAAVAVLQQQRPKEIVAAVPVGPRSRCLALEADVDRIVCLTTPEPFYAIGLWYENFAQTTDEQVRNLLAKQLAAA
ncbi:phosphoribosyltransferase [Leptolyngbya cf. ectocarpi LEGE 11479]|uniref:Phosphoribosyltransferase n=1 Tax=Leptolyngbya cf. ectocarpi LEGE 11479 TaxID=1828722 RepID=A0A928X4H0_LEPEC|nr:phosphoribosyltransferase [Leptolyngbya ectocarpi]MBE9067231.1 phosphoribosyltransferase [Leptolyngbya cf. ectocarpi LEGE 11479]